MTNDSISHLDQGLVYLLAEPDTVRVRFIQSDRFINYPRAVSIIEHAESLALQPKQTRAWGLGVVATPGAGKTMLAAALLRRLTSAVPAIQADGRPSIPALMISMTGAREARTINNRILDALKAPYGPNMRLADREVLVLDLLKRADARILIVDEIQDVLSSTARQRRVALDHIKLLMNSVHIPVLALGIPGAIEAMKEDPHLATRFEWRSLPTWKCTDETRDLLSALSNVCCRSGPRLTWVLSR
jgi:hypothetical protein